MTSLRPQNRQVKVEAMMNRIMRIKAEFQAQLKEEAQLNEIISTNLLKIKIDGN